VRLDRQTFARLAWRAGLQIERIRYRTTNDGQPSYATPAGRRGGLGARRGHPTEDASRARARRRGRGCRHPAPGRVLRGPGAAVAHADAWPMP
jgi:hypothetical protein